MTEYLKSILNAFYDHLFVFTADGIIEDYTATDRGEEFMPPAKELVEKHHRQVLPSQVSQKIGQAFDRLKEGEKQVTFEYEIEMGEKNRWYNAVLSKISNGEGDKFLLAVKDTTDQKKMEKKLALKNEKLTELNRQKDKLFSVISHDLRNAVGGAKGVYSILLQDYDEFSKEDILEYLELLNKNTRETHELLEDLLAWSRVKLGEVTTDIQEVHLSKLTDVVFEKVQSDAGEKGISLENRVPDAIHADADAGMVKKILKNLIANGIKYSHPGGTVMVKAEETGDSVTISVVDEGVGIDENAQEKVLDKDHNYTAFGTNGEKGPGIGLDICIDFVERHGGGIRLESEPGKGSTFTFTLPAQP
ncbi:PAS domain S-box-containing protein [Fodinibius roseus]|uniref:histidine kinase n=1 Tax=Fodinibius roseus TaxID=1194090 RepID=A0A1M5DII1_9BACT|nr:PAS domain-containing sensor histidine kinase [Fodinibius roseus]SHF66793.1 PAS domain S-box-containing protein [Fodinibius roseus]